MEHSHGNDKLQKGFNKGKHEFWYDHMWWTYRAQTIADIEVTQFKIHKTFVTKTVKITSNINILSKAISRLGLQ